MNKCNYCSGELKEYFQVNYKEFCSISCVFDGYKSLGQRLIEGLKEANENNKGFKTETRKTSGLQTKINNKAKQKTQKQKGLHKKSDKQKKGKK